MLLEFLLHGSHAWTWKHPSPSCCSAGSWEGGQHCSDLALPRASLVSGGQLQPAASEDLASFEWD